MLKCASADLEVIILRQHDEPAGEQHNDGVRLAGHEPHAQCAGAAHPAWGELAVGGVGH